MIFSSYILQSKHTPPKISLDDELERATTYAERQIKDRATHFTIGMDGDGRSTENVSVSLFDDALMVLFDAK